MSCKSVYNSCKLMYIGNSRSQHKQRSLINYCENKLITIISKNNNYTNICYDVPLYFEKKICAKYFGKKILDTNNKLEIPFETEIVNILLNIINAKETNSDYSELINKDNCINLYELSNYLEINFIMQECIVVVKKLEFCKELFIFCSKYNILNDELMAKYLALDDIHCDFLDKDFLLKVSQHKMTLKSAYEKYIRYLDPNVLGKDWTNNIKHDDRSLLYIIFYSNKQIEPKHDNMIKKCIESIKN